MTNFYISIGTAFKRHAAVTAPLFRRGKIVSNFELNTIIQLSCEFDPQMHFHSLYRRGLITDESHMVLFSY
jgi:hypothetical protein